MSATRNKFSPEFRDRAVRMVAEHRGDYPSEWAAMTSIAGKIGCTTETLRRWCREEASRRAGPAAQAVSDRDRRDGSVCLNSFRAFCKWISASVMPPPPGAQAG